MLDNGTNATDCSLCCCSRGFHIFIICSMILLIVAILFGNTISLHVFLSAKRFRKPQGYLKVSLAVADLMLGVLVLPFSVYVEISVLMSNSPFLDWAMSPPTEGAWHPCYVVTPVFAGCTLVSIATIFLLTVERSVAIFKPLHKEYLITRRRTLGLISLSWLACFFMAVTPLVFSRGRVLIQYDHCSRMCIYVSTETSLAFNIMLIFPVFDFSLLGGTLLMNGLSLTTIHRYTRRRRRLTGKGRSPPRLSFSDIKAAKTIGALTIIFTASFTPIAVLVVGNVLGFQWCSFSFFAFWILAGNSCCNVVIYCVADRHFLNGVRKLLLLSPKDQVQSQLSISQSVDPTVPDMGSTVL